MSDIRITPKIIPFRRAGLAFGSPEPLVVAQSSLTLNQQRQLANERLLVAEISTDDGATWTPFLAPWVVAS